MLIQGGSLWSALGSVGPSRGSAPCPGEATHRGWPQCVCFAARRENSSREAGQNATVAIAYARASAEASKGQPLALRCRQRAGHAAVG
jgi:hypothetical protein